MLADVESARYRLLLECGVHFQPEAGRLAARVDALLCERNIEYRGKRASGRLAPLELRLMSEGFGDAYRGWCVGNGQRDGQFKTIALQYATDFRFDYAPWIRERIACAPVRSLAKVGEAMTGAFKPGAIEPQAAHP
jgi:hypothetical protein